MEKPSTLGFPSKKQVPGTLWKLSVEEGNEILAKAWQRFSDPVFVRHLLGSLDLSREELQESLQDLERLRPCRDGRARA